MNVLKNGSDYLTNLDIVEYMGKSGLPTVLSTGMAIISEIDDAVNIFRSTKNDNLILLHCTSCYPTPAEDIHLMKIKTLKDTFGVVSGFSDHSEGAYAAIGSVSYGSAWIEKHFTLDRNLPGPDHRFSSDPKEFKELVEGVRYIEQAIGKSYLGPTENEKHSRENYRLSCSSNKKLKKGEILKVEDIIFLRPGYGIAPKFSRCLIGRTIIRDIEPFAILSFEDFI